MIRVPLNYHKYMRYLLFEFLIAYGDTDTKHRQLLLHLFSRLNLDSYVQLKSLVSRGQMPINGPTAHARKMLQEQATIPLVDAINMDREGEVIETFRFPCSLSCHSKILNDSSSTSVC